MNSITSMTSVTRNLRAAGVGFAPEIASAASESGLDPRLLAAVAAQETGGPGSNSGRNILGDGGHGHGVFQIDDRFHDFARSAQAMNPGANARYAAHMLASLLQANGNDVHKALSAYNAGDPNALGTTTPWPDGKRLGYADSVMRHYANLGGEMRAELPTEQAGVNALALFASLQPPAPPPAENHHSFRSSEGDFAALVDPGASSDSNTDPM